MDGDFRRPLRIRSSKEIRSLLREGERITLSDYSLVYSPNNLKHDRFAVLVSRKHGNAVERNRIKRYYRERFRVGKGLSPPFYDIILRPRIGGELPRHPKESYQEWRMRLGK